MENAKETHTHKKPHRSLTHSLHFFASLALLFRPEVCLIALLCSRCYYLFTQISSPNSEPSAQFSYSSPAAVHRQQPDGFSTCP